MTLTPEIAPTGALSKPTGPKLLIVSTVATTLRAFLLPYAYHFRSLGWQVDGAAASVSQNTVVQKAFDHCYDVTWSRQGRDPRAMRQAVQSIASLVASNQYDIVHVHTPIAALLTRYALRNHRQPGSHLKVIYTAHGFHFLRGGKMTRNLAYRSIEQLAGRWTDYLVVINAEDEAAAWRYRIVPGNRIVYMPGIGIDTGAFDPQRVAPAAVEAVRRELGLSDDTPLLLMIAEFNPGKRHRDALQAFARLPDRQAQIAFAGVGPLLPAMQQLATELGVADRTHFLGFRTDIPALMRASIATLLPSEREGLPRSTMESLAMEVPAVGTDIRGVRDLLAGGAGLLVPVGDTERLAQALAWMIDHPQERQAMGRLGRQQMQRYNLQHVIELHEALYRTALSA